MSNPMPALIGHRGLPIEAPENTKASVIAAAKKDIQWIEIDVTMAGDGSLVIMHDNTLKLFGEPERTLLSLNEAQLRDVDAGSWFSEQFSGEPLLFLDGLLGLVKEFQLGLNLEIKINPDLETQRQVTAVYTALDIAKLPHEKLLVSSFDHQALAMLRVLSSTIAIGVLFEILPEHLLNDVIHLLPTSIHCDQSKLTETQARQIVPHYPLYCYTVNDPIKFEKLLGWGVSGIFCDRAYAQEMRDVVTKFSS